jgi:propanol-preferring alcohol dehydrogenase
MEDIALPEPGPGDVRLRVLYCAICRTDLHLIEGDIPTPKLPVIPGHQVVAEIDRAGEGVIGLEQGMPVGVPWLYSVCGRCAYCRAGKENLCDNGRFTGQHADGGYAEYMIAPAAFVYPLHEFSDSLYTAPLLCSGVIGWRSLKLAQVPNRGALGLYGFGSSAHITLQVARELGAQCYVITRGEKGQQHALKLGAVWAGSPSDTPPVALDSIILFAPAGELIPVALTHLEKGGMIACAGIHMTDIPSFSYSILWGERIVRSVANSTREDVRELLAMAAQMALKPDVTVCDFEHLNDHLLSLKQGKFTGTGVVRVAADA